MLAQSIDELIKESIIKGISKGKQEGKLQGQFEGEQDNKFHIALNLIFENYDIEFISRITDLPKDKIDGGSLLLEKFDELLKKHEFDGKLAGIREGIIEGRKEGELRNKRQIVQNLLNEGSDVDFVTRITDLPKDEVLKLRDNI